MARNVKLLLTENVEALGIVGDVVNVRTGYARNFLLPRVLATEPSEEKIKALSAKRAEAERMLAEQRAQREELSKKLVGVEVHLTRSCNDQGILYGAITQHDIADALGAMGHHVKPRDVRIAQVIKRIDTYDVHIKLDSDLDSTIKLWVVADRKLDLHRSAEPTADDAAHAARPVEATEGKPEAKDEATPAEAKAEKPAKPAKGEPKPEGAAGEAKPEKKKQEKKDKKSADGKSEEPKAGDKGGSKWARPVEQSFDFGVKPGRDRKR